jgi:class 3 adenylate cyclase/Tfp pilus assembly protein PilF
MIRYVPAFILNQFEKSIFNGNLTTYVLLIDIADFTQISTTFQKEGKQGAEELSRFLEVVFGAPIKIVEKYGGFVSVFAGDAFCAIFPDSKSENIASAVNSISEYFQSNPIYKSLSGNITLHIRQTICYGTLKWKIFRNNIQNEYVFHGNLMQEIGVLSLQKNDVIWSEAAANRIGINRFLPQGTGFILEDNIISEETESKNYPYSPKTSLLFCHPRYREVKPLNEIRTAAFCFASLEKVADADREDTIATLHVLANKYEAFLNKLDYTDKGLVALLLFGIPHSAGKTLERICSFSVEAVNNIPKILLGISCGSVFSGYIGSDSIKEYTAMGHPVNVASRLMSNARTGEILADTFLWQEMNASYDFDYLGSLYLKGFSLPMRYYQLSQRAKDRAWRQENRFVGRDKELADIRTLIDVCIEAKENSVIYISGDAGIGKSRLVKEALADYSPLSYHKFVITCDTYLPKPLDAIKQIIRTYTYFNPELPEEAGIAMFRGLWKALANGDAELERIESAIAWLLGYEWLGSIWNNLPSDEKPQQLRDAFLLFIAQLAKTKPILIHLDDGQWLEEESKVYLQKLSEKSITPIIIITSCRYLESGEKVDLELSKHHRFDLDLNSLSDKGSYELIKSIVRLQYIPEDTLRLITIRAMGNPLFIEQLTSYLMESNSINDHGVISGEVDYLSSFSISDIISNRIDRLNEKVRECVFNASVLGTEFSVKVLSQMLKGVPVAELEAGVKNRIWREMDESNYIFIHILIKDIIYQRMASDKLQMMHKAAAESMEIVYADKLDEHAIEIAKHFENSNLPLKAAEYYERAGCYFRDIYNFDEGASNLNQALQLRETALGNEHTDTATSLINLAALHKSQGKNELAETLYLRALEIVHKVLDPEHPDIIPHLNNLAVLYQDQDKYEQAEPLYEKALTIREKVFGKKHPETASSLLNLALLYWRQCKFEAAETYYQRVMDIYKTILGSEYTKIADNRKKQTSIYHCQVNQEPSETHQRSLQIREIIPNSEQPDPAGLLSNLANIYWLQGNYEQAIPLYQNVLEIREKEMGAGHRETATVINKLASLFESNGMYEQAEPLYIRALEIRKKVLGIEHPLTAQSMINLAELYDSRDKYSKAEPLYLRALAIREKVLGSEHPLTIQSKHILTRFYDSHGKNKLSEQVYLRRSNIKEKILEPDNLT